MKLDRHLVHDRSIPAADEERCDGAYSRIETGRDSPLDSSHVRFRCCDVLLAGEKQRDVHRDTGEDRFLDRLDAVARPVRALAHECRDRFCVHVIDYTLMAAFHQALRHAGAHTT